MKKSFLLVLLCMLASVLPAQKKMYVWVNEVSTEYSVSDVDSITFADAESAPTPVPEPLSGMFSVSADKQVQFSTGNLQYTQRTRTWSFADRQYEMLGAANVADGALADKIDLFGWSGSTATAKWGISISGDNADYSGDFADWGQNIGDGTTWRTLTNDEWTYLLSTRANASTLKGVARINLTEDGSEYANGLILLPDNWTAPAGVTFQSGFASSYSIQAYADYQTFTLDQWSKLEAAGAVFLPASGFRSGSAVNFVGGYGDYWSATPYSEVRARGLLFYSGGVGLGGYDHYRGQAVRLVQTVDAEPAPTPVPEPLSGMFSVSADKQVQFSCGNLQYTQSTSTWSFAAQQYEMLGAANVAGGALADKIDLFGWSGSTGTAKWGISISEDDADYSGDFVDWGQNIGERTTWRTLTNDEWTYLRNTRTNASALKGVARINLTEDGSKYVNGLILLPDNWTAPEGVTFNSGFAGSYSQQAYADNQTFTLEEWSKLEQAGAVFLPASGCRYGSEVSGVQGGGLYWSATPNDSSRACYLLFYSEYAGWNRSDRYGGRTVRLVQDVQ